MVAAGAGTAERPHLVVDLAGLADIDASCVQVLWRVSRMAEGAGGRPGASPQPPVAWVMELWGAGQVFALHDNVAEAVIAEAGRARAANREYLSLAG